MKVYSRLVKLCITFAVVDIDECTEDIHNCHDDGICINTNGSFYCLCQEGYTGDGVNCTGNDFRDRTHFFMISLFV